MKRAVFACIGVAVLAAAAIAEKDPQPESRTLNKNITVIEGHSTADGKSDVREQVLEECIVSLPSPGELAPEVVADAGYLKEVNGDPNRNEFVKTFSASLDINYMLYQKVLFIVTTNSVPAQQPTMQVMEKRVKQTIRFESNPANGDIFAGRSHRQYYYSSSEAAIADVKKRAEAWLRQQSAVVCPSKK